MLLYKNLIVKPHHLKIFNARTFLKLCYTTFMRKFGTSFVILIIVVGLFISSSQTYEQQSLIGTLQNWLPNKPLDSLLTVVFSDYAQGLILVDPDGYYHFLEYLLRKGAHFVLFGLLAVGFYILLPSRLPRFVIAASITFLLACGDEIHQFFTGGRSATFSDVLLDMSGALFFLLIVQFISWAKYFRKITVEEKE